MKVNQLLNNAKTFLKNNKIENYEAEACFMLEKVLNFNRSELILAYNNHVSEEIADTFNKMLQQRAKGVPLQYCIGEWDFLGERFSVGPGVLIPRPETEELCEYVISQIEHLKSPKVIDLCAGSGCIGISIKKRVPHSEVVSVELSDEAFTYLEKNAQTHTKNSVTLIKGDVLNPESFNRCLEKADVIVSNPPYIRRSDIKSLQREVRFEPEMALDGGEDGYDFYRVICSEWPLFLKDGGCIALECGEDQAAYVADLFDKEIFETEIIEDFASIERFVIGRKKLK